MGDIMRHHHRRTTLIAGLLLALTVGSAAPVAAATPTPTGVWNFNGNFKNSAGTALKMVGVNAPTFDTVTIGSKQEKVVVLANGQGTKITGIPLSGRKTYTIDVWLEFDVMQDTGKDYNRILSFGPNDTDDALYLYDGYPDLYSDNEKYNENIVLAPNTWSHVRVTRNGTTKAMRVYINGTRAFTFMDTTNLFTLRAGTVVFFLDESNADENGVGSIAAVKVWNKVVAP
jgi:hypothetical protein